MYTEQLLTKFYQTKTPFYYYDVNLLECTIDTLISAIADTNYSAHYSLKANSNDKILSIIANKGLSADCVSGNEILQALKCGFKSNQIVFAGVGKTDDDIKLALTNDIACINCESLEEIEVVNDIASGLNKIANIALRLNPNIDAKTHPHITTGLNTNKFGISAVDIEHFILNKAKYTNLALKGIHIHIGSQITAREPFLELVNYTNERVDWFEKQGIELETINVGGGLGIDYANGHETIANFESYFKIFKYHLNLKSNQQVTFELGRSIIAHSGSLISKVLYIKKSNSENFAIIDAGMTDLIRPAMYQAIHRIENISSTEGSEIYHIAGPVCESADVFGTNICLPITKRGDLIAIHTVGAYGQVMASRYNMRDIASAYYSDDFPII